jgi:phage replication O-like protein O
MANPQPDKFTRIANEILDVISKTKFNGTQFRIVMTVWRYTYGFNRKQHFMSEKFIQEYTNIPKRQIQRELSKLIDDNVILVTREATFTTPRELMFNKDYDTWKCRQVTKKTPVDAKDYSAGDGLDTSTGDELVTQERHIKYNLNTKTYSRKSKPRLIFEHWNRKGIIKHQKFTDKQKRKVKTALKDYGFVKLKEIIDTYALITLDDKYYWTHKWSIEDFMQRGLSKFEDRQIAIENYPVKKDKPKNRFHNFDQPALKLTNEELTAILERKKAEADQKCEGG